MDLYKNTNQNRNGVFFCFVFHFSVEIAMEVCFGQGERRGRGAGDLVLDLRFLVGFSLLPTSSLCTQYSEWSCVVEIFFFFAFITFYFLHSHFQQNLLLQSCLSS